MKVCDTIDLVPREYMHLGPLHSSQGSTISWEVNTVFQREFPIGNVRSSMGICTCPIYILIHTSKLLHVYAFVWSDAGTKRHECIAKISHCIVVLLDEQYILIIPFRL